MHRKLSCKPGVLTFRSIGICDSVGILPLLCIYKMETKASHSSSKSVKSYSSSFYNFLKVRLIMERFENVYKSWECFGTWDFVLNSSFDIWATVVNYFQLRKSFANNWSFSLCNLRHLSPGLIHIFVCLINAKDMEISYSNPNRAFHSLKSA